MPLRAVARRILFMKKNFSSFLLVLMLLIGLSLLLYPTVSNYWNSRHQTKTVSAYTEQVSEMSEAEYEALLKRAEAFNDNIKNRKAIFTLSEREQAEYEASLRLDQTGMMGYIEIPAIEVTLPIYHGTDDSVLNFAVGHLDWTSLPIGGESTHCVLSGHRGLPSAKLFTNLDKLSTGDIFILRIFDEVLAYEVDQILIVNPDETDELQIVDGKDYCTLVTCTPYGINTHRLLVRGHRVENADVLQTLKVVSDAVQIDPILIAPLIACPVLLFLLIILLLPNKQRKNRGGTHENRS